MENLKFPMILLEYYLGQTLISFWTKLAFNDFREVQEYKLVSFFLQKPYIIALLSLSKLISINFQTVIQVSSDIAVHCHKFSLP